MFCQKKYVWCPQNRRSLPSTWEITSPTEGEIINDGYFNVKGKAQDENYPIYYAVKIKPRPFVSNGWTTILSGELDQSDAEDGQGNAIEITFGRCDTTAISNGTYKLQLEITDGGGNVVTAEIDCTVNSTLKVGQYTRTDPPDLSVAYSGELPFEFVRSYNSHNLSRGSLHYGWMHNYEASLYEDISFTKGNQNYVDENYVSYGYVIVKLPEGGNLVFSPPGGQQSSPFAYNPPKGVKATLTRATSQAGPTDYDATYELTTKDGTKYFFTATGLEQSPTELDTFTSALYQEQDRYGNAIAIAAFTDANGSGAEIKDALGRAFRLYEDETGRITKVIYGIWDEFGNETSDVTREVRYLYEDKTNDFTADTFTVVKYANNVVGEDGTMIPVPVELKTKYTYEDKRLTKIYEPNQINTPDPKRILENYYNASGALSDQTAHVSGDQYSVNYWVYEDQVDQGTGELLGFNTYIIGENGGGTIQQKPDGAIEKGEVIPIDSDVPVAESQSFYEDTTNNPFSPTKTKEKYDYNGDGVTDTFTTDFVYEIDGDMTKRTLHKGAETHDTNYAYDTAYNRVTQTTTQQGFDGAGRTVETLSAYAKADGSQGAASENKYLTEQKVLLDDSATPEYAVTTHTYDESGTIKGLLKTTTNPELVTTTLDHDAYGNAAKTTSDNKITSRSHYDSQGNRLLEAGMEGSVTRYKYDGLGRLYEVRTYEDTTALTRPDFTPDVYDPLTPLTTHTYGYDLNGNKTYERTPDGIVTRWEYNLSNCLTRVIYHDGSCACYTYYDNGEKASEHRCDPQGNLLSKTSYVYDSLKRLTDQYDYDFDGETVLRHTHYEYYDSGLKSREQIFGPNQTIELETRYYYDELKRLIKTVADPDGYNIIVRYGYDAVGNRIWAQDPKGNYGLYDYDNANRLIRESFPEPPPDPRNPDQAPTWTEATQRIAYEYYKDGKRKQVTKYDSDGTTALSWTKFQYDSLGRLITVEQPIDLTTQPETTAVTTFDYRDIANGETGWTFTGDPVTYDKRMTDAEGKERYEAHDSQGRLIKIRYPDGDTQEFVYDQKGRKTKQSVFVYNDVTKVYDNVWVEFKYYDDGKLKKKIYPDSGYIEYQYDCLGRRSAVLDFRGAADSIGGTQAIYYSYDALARLATVTQQDGRIIEYTYNATGTRTEVKVTENGQTIYRNAYSYDSADRLSQVYDDPTGQSPTLVATYNYDANGNRSLLYYDQVGLGASYTYNDSNQLTSITSAPASFTYTVHALGRRANATETLSLIGGGAVSYAVDYAYDDLSRLMQDKRDKTGAGTLYDTGYEYDAVGNRLAKIDNPTQQPTDSYTYWPGTDKLFQINGADDRSYDPNGNTTDRSGGDIYEYDYDNMLKRVHKPGGTTYEYYYDPDGARIRKEKIQNGQVVEATNYIIDANTTYAQVIIEIDDQNVIIASYTYGDDLLKVSRNGEYFYWYDGLGSIRIITDITGAVANRYTYDAYGNLIDGEYAETIANEYKFTGERVDAETGFVYLRARMYEPSTGRFLSRDLFAGDEADPPSLHKYLYCHDDPTNRVDPSGNLSLVEMSVASAIRMTLSGIQLKVGAHALRRVKGIALELGLESGGIELMIQFFSVAGDALIGIGTGALFAKGVDGLARWAASRGIQASLQSGIPSGAVRVGPLGREYLVTNSADKTGVFRRIAGKVFGPYHNQVQHLRGVKVVACDDVAAFDQTGRVIRRGLGACVDHGTNTIYIETALLGNPIVLADEFGHIILRAYGVRAAKHHKRIYELLKWSGLIPREFSILSAHSKLFACGKTATHRLVAVTSIRPSYL